ncbi:MAG: 50S ribosomal protein L11 methyltransferase [Planctomycetota bacterium]
MAPSSLLARVVERPEALLTGAPAFRVFEAAFADAEAAATWAELVAERSGCAVAVEEIPTELWIAGDREGAARRHLGVVFCEAGSGPSCAEALAGLEREGWPAAVRSPEREASLAAGWRAQHPVVTVGSRLRVLPPWRAGELADGRAEVRIEPGRGFGGGDHASTRTCLELLEWARVEGARVADLGTGSGVLALAALALGAIGGVAVDREEGAVEDARANAARNGVADRLEVRLGGVEALGEGPFDVLLANVFGARLPALLPPLLALAAPGARAILGGILPEDESAVRAAIGSLGGRVEAERRADDFLALGLVVRTG